MRMGFVTYYSIFPKTYEFSNSNINNITTVSVSSQPGLSSHLQARLLGATLLFLFIAEQSRAARPVNLKQCSVWKIKINLILKLTVERRSRFYENLSKYMRGHKEGVPKIRPRSKALRETKAVPDFLPGKLLLRHHLNSINHMNNVMVFYTNNSIIY